ncbi:GDP/GTP exchange factor for ARF, partial [Spiromyces aspiralis]
MGRPAEMWCGTTNVPWRLFIENEIDSVVRELHKNSRWTGIAKRAGIGALWTGGSRLPTKFICEQKGAMFEYPLTADGYVTPGGSDVTEECWRLYRSRHDMGKLGVGMGLQGYGSGEVEDYLSEFEKFSRLYGFLTLRERLCAMTANESLNGAAEILDPFLDIVRTGEATGPIARAALVSVGRLMNAGLLKDLPDEDVAMALLLVTQAVTNCQFEETDSATNESVLLEILNVLRLMMSSELSSRLTDEVVCKIIETVLSMSCQMRLSEILRKSAESALFELVSVVFCRLRYLAQSGGNVGQGRAT